MTNELPITEFAAKIWIYKVQALIFGVLGIFSVVMGPLYFFQIMLNAHGKPATDAGVALTIMSAPLLCLFALAVFNIWVRRMAPIQLFQEGLAVKQIGSSSLDRSYFVPALFRIAWLIVSLQGFKYQTIVMPWETFGDAVVSGLLMNRALTLLGTAYGLAKGPNSKAVILATAVTFAEVDFKAPLERIAEAINYYRGNLDSRNRLPSLREST